VAIFHLTSAAWAHREKEKTTNKESASSFAMRCFATFLSPLDRRSGKLVIGLYIYFVYGFSVRDKKITSPRSGTPTWSKFFLVIFIYVVFSPHVNKKFGRIEKNC
jgi:hypothetical protein